MWGLFSGQLSEVRHPLQYAILLAFSIFLVLLPFKHFSVVSPFFARIKKNSSILAVVLLNLLFANLPEPSFLVFILLSLYACSWFLTERLSGQAMNYLPPYLPVVFFVAGARYLYMPYGWVAIFVTSSLFVMIWKLPYLNESLVDRLYKAGWSIPISPFVLSIPTIAYLLGPRLPPYAIGTIYVVTSYVFVFFASAGYLRKKRYVKKV